MPAAARPPRILPTEARPGGWWARRRLLPALLPALLLAGPGAPAAPAAPAPPAAPAALTARTYGVAEGLPNRLVQALWRAPSGALWVGTGLGAARFDGTSFYQPAALAGVRARALGGVAERELWIGGHEGVRRFDLQTGAVRHWRRPDAAGRPGADQQVRTLLVSRAGTLYIGTENGWLLRYDTAAATFRRLVQVPRAAPSHGVWLIGLAEDPAGNLWCSTSYAPGAYRYIPRTGALRAYPDAAGPHFPAVAVAVGAGGEVVANFAGRGLARYHPATDTFRPLGPPPTDGRAAFFEPVLYPGAPSATAPGGYWLTRWRSVVQRLTPRPPAPPDTLDLNRALGTTGAARCFLADGAGGHWVGTTDGLLHLTPHPARFGTRLMQPPARPLSARYSLRGLAELADGRLLVASYRGLYLLDATAPDAAPQPVIRAADTPELRGLFAYAVLPDSADRGAWLATEGGGLGWLDLRTGVVHFEAPNLPDRQQSMQRDTQGRAVSNFGRVLLRNPDGSLWLGTYEGLFRVTRPGTAAARYHRVTAPAWPDVTYLDCFALVRRGEELWVGARQGVYVVDARTGAVRRRLRPDRVRLPVRALWAEPAAGGALWLGTAGGLVRLDPAAPPGRQLRTYDQRAGLSHDVVAALLPDDCGGLWVSSNNGLTRFDRRTRVCQSFLLPDGLSAAEFNHGAALRRRGGGLLFGTVNGLTTVTPQAVGAAPPPRVLLTQLAWFDGATRREQRRWLGLTPGTQLTLDPDDEGFTLHYTLTDLADPARHRFRYRLRGLETGWMAAGAAHSLHYSRLPAGRYVLELLAAGADGRWLPPLDLLRVRVIAPFYARWWFIGLVGLAVVALVVAAWRYRVRRLHELAAVRVRLAADLHDEVGAWLTRVSLHAELARVASPTPEQQARQLEKLTAASRQAIATMSDVVWAVDARNDTLGDLADRLREQANQLLEPHGIAFEFRADTLYRARALPPELRQHLFLIGKEALHNIVRHSATARARVFLGNRQGAFELEVTDEGPARAVRASGSRQGLRNMEMRARQLPGAVLTIGKAPGYTVCLRLAHPL